MITFFSIPKAFNGHFQVIQRNAIKSWSLLPGQCEIILFGDEAGTDAIAREMGAQHIKDCETTSHGTPRVDDIFKRAQEIAKYDLLCYVNADIILLSDFIEAAMKVKAKESSFLLIGQRWDVEVKEFLSFDDGWEQNFSKLVSKQGILHGYTGIDYFLFRKGLWKTIPPFAIGRTSWDNWLIYEARRQHAAVIDATEIIHAVHQNHDYSHAMGGDVTVWKGIEAQTNFALAGGYRYCFTIMDSTKKMRKVGIRSHKFDWQYLKRRTATWMILHPALLKIIDIFRKNPNKKITKD